ncbi:GPO family capsid scaffolding protein [Erwinia pyrifoliae]|uniref:GPO family capsid scaffolding protein n=1 Tax=Erwinia pyrifoliae TaxID=79967 RepID=A0ABY5XCW0_ERWPY|nr:GPO family capsid scaffolding protein [Erwinia pyrifoliae]MCT2387311.1 GPO family capsid scaffolding protein [Erwinia pyrifoliae]MCU8587089.1 GPO family capsid scaffolding protein [Erwinia pyrifoliae]UWS30952.1 GPO family capsid scaffolding protein [Erwinia pyrifoliae]UWS35250.1 GPO family capsid scaffolding protein [Erwinia pyrifoliae]
MPSPNIITDWVCIATSGQAVDGRVIEPQWLVDAAETYSRKTYTAMVWPHHPHSDIREREFTCNLGEVDALKVETDGEKTKLFAQIIPNQFLIDANRQGQKLFTSAEFVSDFAGSGREYLFGLAVTDIPASLGTEKITFNLAGEQKEAGRGSLETFSLGTLKNSNKPSFWGKLFSTRDNVTPPPENKPAEGEETQMDELKAMLQQMLDLLQAGQETAEGADPAAETPEVAAEEVAAIAEDIADAAEEVAELAQDVADNPEDEVKAEEFSAAKASLLKAMKAYTAAAPKSARRRRRQFSARKNTKGAEKKNLQLETLSAQLGSMLTTLSAQESGTTPRPGNAPAGSKKPHEFC